MERTEGRSNISTQLARIAELSKKYPQGAHTTLAHHIDVEFLKEAFRRTRKDGSAGVDGVTASEYAQNLEGNLRDLLERFKSGRYIAPPVRRAHIPKGDGSKTRPIGIPAFEDKVLQRAVTMVLEAVYEPEFIDGSYGFRPGRSAHQALEAIWRFTMSMRGGWVLEADVESFFDRLDHGHMREFLGRRVRDGVIVRAIGKWLNAGVMEASQVHYPDSGSPQGGVVSPILSNIYLHEVLDLWFEREVKPRLRGRGEIVRYADDFVILLEHKEDADRVMDVLPKRLGKYSLTLHPDKTRIVRFERPSNREPGRPKGGIRTFDFLGLTHHWGKSRKGSPIVQRRTMHSRFARTLRRINEWCAEHRHEPVQVQHRTLRAKLAGHYSYFGITGNMRALIRGHAAVWKIWRYWLGRRGGKRRMTVERYDNLLKRYPLPTPRIAHSAYLNAANT